MRSLFFAGPQLRSGWKALGFLLLTALFGAGLLALHRLLPAGVRYYVPGSWVAFLAALLATALCVRRERRPLSSVGFRLDLRFARQLGAGVLGGLGLVALSTGLVFLAGGFHFVRVPEAQGGLLLRSAFVMLGVGLVEETVFHGYAFQRGIRGMGPRWALFVFSAIFALAHPFEPGMDGSLVALAVLNTFLAGWMLGLCYLRTGHLALPVGVHFGWNWLQGTLGFGVSGNASKGLWTPVFHDRPVWLTGGDFGLEASVIGVGVLALAVAGLSLWKGAGARVAPPVDVPGYRVSGRA